MAGCFAITSITQVDIWTKAVSVLPHTPECKVQQKPCRSSIHLSLIGAQKLFSLTSAVNKTYQPPCTIIHVLRCKNSYLSKSDSKVSPVFFIQWRINWNLENEIVLNTTCTWSYLKIELLRSNVNSHNDQPAQLHMWYLSDWHVRIIWDNYFS